MSRFTEMLAPAKQKLLEIFEKIKESEIYQKGDEKYNSLSPRGQKIARYITSALIIFLLLFYPLSRFSVSKEFIAEYEGKRDLIRSMFKTYRQSSGQASMMPAPESSQLIDQIRSQLTSAQLLPEQIKGISSIEPEGRMIPKNLVHHAVSVELNQLNLRQAVEIGTQIANISTSIKLKDLKMNASVGKAGYFDVTYKVYAFNVPQAIQEAPPDAEPPKGKKTQAKDSTEESKGNEEE